jgi:glycosyltransferase involved in cell wall biosynthesis
MNESPLVSAIIPVFNGERYLEEAIDSVRAQAVEALELILVDDGSTDGSASLARRVAPDAALLHQANQGPGSARNAGVRRARGEFIAFLDADDLWVPGKLARQLGAFEREPSLDIVTGLVEQFRSAELDPATSARLSCPDRPIPGMVFGATLIRRAAFERVGPIATDLTLGEAIDWFARARALGVSIRQHEEIALRRRLHDTNLTLRHRQSASDYARVLKACLDRRRAADSPTPGTTREAG